VGKSTIFNALTAAGAQTANYPFTTIEPNHGLAVVPEPRLQSLGRLAGQSQTVPAAVEFVDIAGLVQGASQGQGLGNQFLGHIRQVDLIVHVLRCFSDPNVTHHDPIVDPARDADLIRTELVLADLEILERRQTKIRKVAQSGDREAQKALAAYERFAETLQAGKTPAAIRGEEPLLAELGLLTAKPVLLVANVDEAELKTPTRVPVLQTYADSCQALLVSICGDLEAEMIELEPDERAEFLASLGLRESGLNRLIQAAFQVLGLITFFTIVGAEVRAWPVRAGTTAMAGAGKIHTDMARGFIAAETIDYENLIAAGSMAAAREAGLVRIEGQNYVLADGDVVTFRFHV